MTALPNSRASKQSGIGVVEIMVALVLALLLTGGVIQIFLNSKQGYRVQEGAARLQENARFGMANIERSVRQAGYRNPTGIDKRVEPVDFPSTTDAFPSRSNVSTVAGTLSFRAGQTISGTDNNTVTTDKVMNGSDTLTVRGKGNLLDTTINCLGSNVPRDKFSIDTFYVGIQEAVPALRCQAICEGCDVGGGNRVEDQPLAMGVESLQVLYGMDVDNDPTNPRADCFINSSAVAATATDCASLSFGQVTSVRLALLVSSSDNDGKNLRVDKDQTVFDLVGTPIRPSSAPSGLKYDETDRRLRRVFSTTIALRNKLK